MDRLYLPDDKKKLSTTLVRMCADAKREQNVAAVEWYIVRHYLRGCRFFQSIEYNNGAVRPTYQNSTGGIPFKYEELINKFVTEVGRLQRLDVSPAVIRQSTGLDGLRDESTTQAVLNSIHTYLDPETLKRRLLEALVLYGCVGLLAYQRSDAEKDKDNPAASLGVEVVPPWEILMLPASARTPSEVGMWGRQRWISLEQLRATKLGNIKLEGLGSNDDDELEIRWVPIGSMLAEQNAGGAFGTTKERYPQRKKSSKVSEKQKNHEDDTEPYVKLTEGWVAYANGRLKQYVVMVGKKIVHNAQHPNRSKTPLMPIGVAIRGEGIGMYGRSYIGPLISLNHEIEASILNLLKNVQDLDLFGMLGVPVSFGITQDDMDSMMAGKRKYVFMDRDATAPNDQIERIQPVTSGTLPDLVLQRALGMLDRMGQQPDIVTQGEAPGRVESTPALNFLYQASTLPLSTVASSIASVYGTVYRALLGFARRWDNVQLNMSSLVDEAIIGITFDSSTGVLDLSDNVLPDPTKMDIGVRSQKPVDVALRKQELLAMFDRQLVTLPQFKIINHLEQLDYPLGDSADWQNYRMAVIRNITLFNDGKTPGDLSANTFGPSEYDIPEIHLMVLNRLMASPEFALASPAVQEKFESLLQEHMDRSGKYPTELPMPEEEAGLAQGGPQQGGPQQGGPPAGEGGPNLPSQEQMMQALTSLQGTPGGEVPPLQ